MQNTLTPNFVCLVLKLEPDFIQYSFEKFLNYDRHISNIHLAQLIIDCGIFYLSLQRK